MYLYFLDERPKGWSKKSFVLGCFSGFGMGSVITAILVTFILLIVLRQDKNTKADKSDCMYMFYNVLI